jgi:hypothetical protein
MQKLVPTSGSAVLLRSRQICGEGKRHFALKTIQRVQGEIAALKRRKPTIRDSSEDSWRP